LIHTALGSFGWAGLSSRAAEVVTNLVTRHSSSPKEVVLEIDWKPFESHQAYLEDIILEPRERVPEVFTGSNHGTRLIMRDARERWRDDDLRRLQASLQKLKSPTRGAADFEVKVHCPEYPQYENLDSIDLLDKAHFSLMGILDEDGMIEFDYEANLMGRRSELRRERRNLWHELHPKLDRKPNCGPFYVDLNAWIRKAELLRQTGVTREQLNAFCGVSLFRDGIRVLPYGDEGDDWLLLDKCRIDDPTRRFANNQVIGFVEINQTANRQLVDKANREGLQENVAFLDMRDLVRASVALLEQLSVGERNKLTGEKKEDAAKTELVTTIAEVEAAARKSETEARAVTRAIETMESKGWLKPEAAETLTKTVEGLAVEVSNYREKAESANQTVKELFSDEEKERETFLHLVAVGLVAERFTHEFVRVVKQCADTVRQLRIVTKGDASAQEGVADLERYVAELQNELLPLGNMVHRSTLVGKEECDVPALVETVLGNNQARFKKEKIIHTAERSGQGSFITPLRESLLAQVLDNLVDNAVYWLGQKSARDDRILLLHLDSTSRTILVTNNGPPVAPNMRSRLFQKFQTTKFKGHGLGLFICRELLTRHGGNIRLTDSEADKRCLSGGSFLVQLPETRAKK